MTKQEKQRKQEVETILDGIAKTSPFDILTCAANEIWNKGKSHFTEKTINANIAYLKSEDAKPKSGNPIISYQLQIQIYEAVRQIVNANITVKELGSYLSKKK